MTDLAFSANDQYVPIDRWIATLSNGQTVYQNCIEGRKSAWTRLREYVEQNKLHITSLRLQALGHTITLPPHDQVDGYWHSNRARALLGGHTVQEEMWVGIGYIFNDQVHITWLKANGDIKHEVRTYVAGSKAAILPVD